MTILPGLPIVPPTIPLGFSVKRRINVNYNDGKFDIRYVEFGGAKVVVSLVLFCFWCIWLAGLAELPGHLLYNFAIRAICFIIWYMMVAGFVFESSFPFVIKNYGDWNVRQNYLVLWQDKEGAIQSQLRRGCSSVIAGDLASELPNALVVVVVPLSGWGFKMKYLAIRNGAALPPSHYWKPWLLRFVRSNFRRLVIQDPLDCSLAISDSQGVDMNFRPQFIFPITQKYFSRFVSWEMCFFEASLKLYENEKLCAEKTKTLESKAAQLSQVTSAIHFAVSELEQSKLKNRTPWAAKLAKDLREKVRGIIREEQAHQEVSVKI